MQFSTKQGMINSIWKPIWGMDQSIMDEKIMEIVKKYCGGGLIQIILSNSRNPKEIKKVLIRPVQLKGELFYQACEYRGSQVFHKNHLGEELPDKIILWLKDTFRQAQVFAEDGQATILVSKKGKVTVSEKKNAGALGACGIQPAGNAQDIKGHNRQKNYILTEGCPIPFLVDLGVMTPEGKVVNVRYDKFRQINRFLEFIEDVLPNLPKEREITVIDFGCGKSYLTFAMYYYLHELRQYKVRITGLDLKEDVISRCADLAVRYGYEGLHFCKGDIASYQGAENVDMVVTLHACDTATDAALKKAVDWGARVILSVPCCQHELNKTISNDMLAPVLRYGLLKERMAALITDGLRADLLEQLGYRVQVLEFIDMEHTPKNILLRAVRKNELLPARLKEKKREEYLRCIRELSVNPALYRAFFTGE